MFIFLHDSVLCKFLTASFLAPVFIKTYLNLLINFYILKKKLCSKMRRRSDGSTICVHRQSSQFRRIPTIQSAGVAPEVNLRITTGNIACKQGIHPGFETRTDVNSSPNQGYQWPHKKDLSAPNFFLQEKPYLVSIITTWAETHQRLHWGTTA